MTRTPEELERALGVAERRAVELQAWVDSSEQEVEQLSARLAQLETPPAPQSEGRVNAELQAWLDASEQEVAKLRARVNELETAPAPKKDAGGANAELQAWLDASEDEVAKLRARLTEVEAAPALTANREDTNVELQAQLAASEQEVAKLRVTLRALEQKLGDQTEVEKLRATVKDLEHKLVHTHAQDVRRVHEVEDRLEAENATLRLRVATEEKLVEKDGKQAHELQVWLDAAEAENEKLRAQLSECDPAEARQLRDRVSELETSAQALREMNKRFSDQVHAGAQRDIARLQHELEAALATGNQEKVIELELTLHNAREAIATLESERASAVAQVQRYASRDSAIEAEQERKTKADLDSVKQEKDAKIAVLQASLGAREAELKTLEQRLIAYVTADTKQKEEFERVRRSDCEAREQLGHVRDERDRLESEKRALDHDLSQVTNTLTQTRRSLEAAEAERAEAQKKLEAVLLEVALKTSELHEASKAATLARAVAPRPAEPESDEESGIEGFSVARLHRLEALLAAEKARADALSHFVHVAERSVAAMQDQLDFARGRLADLTKKLGLTDGEFDEALERLDGCRRELIALRTELAMPAPPPPPIEEDAPLVEEDVISAPLDAVQALAESQAAATKQATEVLQGEQRAREQLITDLSWVKTELEKVSHVRDDLRGRIAAMVQRELRRKGVVAALLDQLRKTEVAAASRVAALRRLQAAIEVGQRMAVKVQTVYFQKQIGSLQRQLEAALGKRKAPPGQKPLVPVRRA